MVGQGGDLTARPSQEVICVQPEHDLSGSREQTSRHGVILAVTPLLSVLRRESYESPQVVADHPTHHMTPTSTGLSAPATAIRPDAPGPIARMPLSSESPSDPQLLNTRMPPLVGRAHLPHETTHEGGRDE